MFIWIDPPGTDPGTIHEISGPDDIAGVLALHPIPDDNDDRRRAYETAHEGERQDVYQAGRDYWGITDLTVLPADLPDGIRIEALRG